MVHHTHVVLSVIIDFGHFGPMTCVAKIVKTPTRVVLLRWLLIFLKNDNFLFLILVKIDLLDI